MGPGDVGGDLREAPEASAAIDQALRIHIDVVEDAPVFTGEPRTRAKLLASATVAQTCKRFIVEAARVLGLQSPDDNPTQQIRRSDAGRAPPPC